MFEEQITVMTSSKIHPPEHPPITVVAYGFDAIGFQPLIDTTNINTTVKFEHLGTNDSLDNADGVIIPQGIFENIGKTTGFYSGSYTEVSVRKDLLLETERQILNLLNDGKWLCFLIGEIVDTVPHGYSERDISDTDLCKNFLNMCGVRRVSVDGLTALDAKYNEFIKYVREYRVAKTILELPSSGDIESRILVECSNKVVGVEFHKSIFFLPFHTSKRDGETLISIVTTVCNAIFDYRQKLRESFPEWLGDFRFNCEESLQLEIESHLEEASTLQSKLKKWGGYKSILTTSGEILRDKVIVILEDFFGVKVDPVDQGKEDAKVIDDNSATLCFLETKGTKTGIKREYVNQVDSHRERNEVAPSVPGVLFINNEMGVVGVEKRLRTEVPEEQIVHARRLNVLIIRTIDLLFLMRLLEDKPLEVRKGKLLKIFNSGGGWLEVSSDSYDVTGNS